ncbi:MAG: hypothetical protein KAG95_06965, partial [Bacteroidales bacterium]|nr:hypothetical protein [Bacteroidales bacterium]
MKKFKTILFLTIIPIQLLFSQVENLDFERITVENGLSQSTVYSICQDSLGFMWFGTQNRGLNKYDGYAFNVYLKQCTNNNSLSSNNISKLITAKDGNLYIGTWGGGLCVFDLIHNKFTNYKHIPDSNSISHNKAQTVFEDSEGIIWIGTESGGLNKFNPKTKLFKHYKNDPHNPNSISSNRIWDVKQENKDILWIATSNGICKFNKTREIFTCFAPDKNNNNSVSNSQVRTLFVDKTNKYIWIGTATGLDRLGFDNKQFKHFQFKLDNNKTNSINKI